MHEEIELEKWQCDYCGCLLFWGNNIFCCLAFVCSACWISTLLSRCSTLLGLIHMLWVV